MILKTHRMRWWAMFCLHLAPLFTTVAYAQVNYLSIYGNSGCSNNNRMTCATTPSSSSFTGIPVHDDPLSGIYSATDFFKNSVYDKSGNLLFSVNANGIYAPNNDGDQVYSFLADIITPTTCSGTTYDIPTPTRNAVSEFVIFPVSGSCYSYYVMFWSNIYFDFPTIAYLSPSALRIIRVDISPTLFGNTSVPANSWYSITDKLMQPPTCSNYDNPYVSQYSSPSQIVADKLNPDNSRDIYTINEDRVSDTYGGIHYFSTIKKWNFPASGIIPTSSVTVFTTTSHTDPMLLRSFYTKAKIFRLPTGTPGVTDPVIAYVGKKNTNIYGNYLQTYNLNTGDMHLYKAPLLLGASSFEGNQNIWGFEYLPTHNIFCFSFEDFTTGYSSLDGGMGYATPGTGFTPTNITQTISNWNYGRSDMELTKNGDLLCNYANSSPFIAQLAYLSGSSLTSSFTTTLPTILSRSCSGGLYDISIHNYLSASNIPMTINPKGFYLGNQIRGEDYSAWGPDISSVYTVTGTETWTPTANPVATASGVSTSSISCRGIVIEPGGSLTIQGMTVKMTENSFIDVKASTSSAAGGRLFLDNATLTSNTGGCDNPTWSMWGGVRVLGVPTQPQGGVLSSKQGYVKMINNSEISYAHTAIQAGMLGTVTFYIFTMPITIPIPANGGGIVQAFNSTFRNNNNGVVFFPYSNTNPVTGATLNNISFFHSDKFLSDDVATIVNGSLKHISGMNVKGIRVYGTDFQNNTGVFTNSYGIYAQNMGITVDNVSFITPYSVVPSKFTGFGTGIYHTSNGNSTTLTVRNSEFHNNYVGIHLSHTQGAVVANNLFNVPGVAAVSVISPSPFYTPTPFQTIGVFLQYANLFSVYNNTFQYASYVRVGRHGAANGTVGVLAYETGAQNNVINNNKYNGLSTANLANFGNRYGANGLWYKCNDMSNNGHDIAARGSDPGNPSDMNVGHGIRIYQGLPAGYTGYSAGQTAGNTFSKGSNFNIYNNTATECTPFTYYYSSPSFGGLPTNKPGEPGVTGLIFNTAMAGNVTMLNTANRCSLDMYNPDGMASLGGLLPISVSMNWRADEKYTAVVSNINYYMADSAGVTHRDSLYYWVNELQTPDAALMTANMLLEDSLIDSAYAVYDAIATTYTMSSKDSMAYAHSGKQLFMVQVAEAIKGGAPTTLFAALAAHIDTLADSMYFEEQITDIVAAYEGTTGWARGRAQNMLLQYSKTLYDSMVQVMPDTLLFPVLPDSILAQPSPKGSLAVTEFSQGPVAGCQYAELTVTSCDANSSPYADVRGWMINDYSGALTECSPYNANPGHYRLAYDAMWANVTVGSVIVLYNGANNCYNLPDSFSIDTFNSVYYIPVGGAGALHVEQYYPAEGSSPCSYCSDSGATVYSDSLTWDAISIDSVLDAIQVLCPGCTVDIPQAPRVYFGAGFYLQEGTSGAKGTDSIGYVVIRNTDSASGYKYVFTGINANQLLSPNMWTVSIADPAGSKPATLGNVNTEFFERILTHTALMPCCGATQGNEGGEGAGRPGKDENTKGAMQGAAGVKVYPNPASMLLYFEYTASPKATIRITDVTGRLIDQQVVKDAGKAAIDVKGYAPGVYMYQITTDATTQTGKVVIGN